MSSVATSLLDSYNRIATINESHNVFLVQHKLHSVLRCWLIHLLHSLLTEVYRLYMPTID